MLLCMLLCMLISQHNVHHGSARGPGLEGRGLPEVFWPAIAAAQPVRASAGAGPCAVLHCATAVAVGGGGGPHEWCSATGPPQAIVAVLPEPLQGSVSCACLLKESSLIVHSTCSPTPPKMLCRKLCYCAAMRQKPRAPLNTAAPSVCCLDCRGLDVP